LVRVSSTDHGGGKRRAEDIGWKILRASDYYNGMKRKLFKTHKDRWEQGFAALCKFRRRKGHCCPPQRHVEGKYNLGSWVIIQRYSKDHLSVERKKRLDKIGFVWNWRDFAWERGFAALLKFKRQEGHCRVRGQWKRVLETSQKGSLGGRMWLRTISKIVLQIAQQYRTFVTSPAMSFAPNPPRPRALHCQIAN
jgi:Helicase associated domain